MNKLILLLSILCFSITCKAQPTGAISTKSKKAEKAYFMAMDYAEIYDMANAYKQLAIAKKEDPGFVEAYTLEANLLMSERKWAEAIDQFKKAFAINPTFFPSSYYDCAMAELKLGRYADAKKDFQTYLDTHRPNASPKTIESAQLGLASCNFAINALAHPVPFNPINMGESVNTTGCEYFPNVTADDATFLFTRNQLRRDANTGIMVEGQEDFYISYKDENGKWSVAQNLGVPINTPNDNEGAPSLSADGRFLFFAACAGYDGYGNGKIGFGSCDIFFSQKVNNVWSKPQNVGAPVNTVSWDSQPSFSSDGKTLYFVSHRNGGLGSADIWMAVLGADGKWGPATNLGPGINTSGNEEAVYIHPDNQTLYYASDGLTGMGGLDLYVCRRDTVTGKWGAPVNMGYPINTEGDESGMIVNGAGKVAYFSSDRKETTGCQDIYMFNLPKEFQPVPVTYMKGKTFDKKTLKPVGNASFELINLSTGKTVITSFSDAVTGEFLVCLPVNENYALNVNATGYTFYSENFELKKVTDASKPFRMDVPLQPIVVDSAHMELKNVFFETGKYDLKPESKAELNKMVIWMKTNSAVKIEISGHTDNVGDKKSNITLSTNRAKSVYDYLVANGVDASRMTYKGYGDTKPKVANDTPEHRQMNRRTEWMITGIK
jgi:outer membrane protein OmpA-like peptidoglycan-associated protein